MHWGRADSTLRDEVMGHTFSSAANGLWLDRLSHELCLAPLPMDYLDNRAVFRDWSFMGGESGVVELLWEHILLPRYLLTNTRRIPGYPFIRCSMFPALNQDLEYKIVKIGPLEAKICPNFFMKVFEIGQ